MECMLSLNKSHGRAGNMIFDKRTLHTLVRYIQQQSIISLLHVLYIIYPHGKQIVVELFIYLLFFNC